jgi:cytochrome c biogenesis factor
VNGVLKSVFDPVISFLGAAKNIFEDAVFASALLCKYSNLIVLDSFNEALISSLMTLTPKLLGGYSGTIVSNIGYPNFFLMTTLIGIPILILVVWVAKLLRDHENQTTQQTGE